MAPKIQDISLDIRTQAIRLSTEGWDKLRAVRLAHAAVAVRETVAKAGWLEASGRAEDLARQVGKLIEKAPSPSEVAYLALLSAGLADCLDSFLLAGLEEAFLPADTEQWTFLLLGEGLSATSPCFAMLYQAGFRVDLVAHSEALAGRGEIQKNQAIVVATAEWLTGNPIPLVRRKRPGSEGPVVIALADEASFMTRLAAQRAGANMLLDQSVTAEALVATLSGLAWPPRKPYRAMIVDDDTASLEFHAQLLRRAGMEVAAFQDPVAVLDLLDDFEPEALVVDIEMPACRGTELVAMLRQRESRALLPVVYLSAYGDTEHLLEARHAGGEDYLVKPVHHDLFHIAVSTRARKYRLARQIDRAREREKERSRRLREAVDAHAIVSVAATDGSIVDANEKFMKISGHSLEELIGHSHRVVNSGFHPPELFQGMWSDLSAGRIWQGEVKNRRKDGRYYWVKSTIVPLPQAGGLPRQYISVRTDITGQKFHQELHESRNRLLSHANIELKGMLEQVIVEMKSLWLTDDVIPAILLLDDKNTFYVGAAPDLPDSYRAVIDGAKAGNGEGACGMAAALDKTVIVEDIMTTPERGVFSAFANQAGLRACWSLPIRIPSGEVAGTFAIYHRTPHKPGRLEQVMLAEFSEIVGILVDRDHMIQGRAKSERMLASILEAADEGYWRVDAEGITREVNHTFSTIAARPERELIGKPYTDILEDESAAVATSLFSSVRAGSAATGELHIRRPDGKLVPVMMRGGLVPSTGGDGADLFALVTDITQKKQLEESLRAARDAAESANLSKSEFLMSMSHELRTPLNAILGFSQLFGMDPNLPKETKGQAGEIERAGRHLLSLVNGLIDLARIEAGKMSLSPELVPVKPVMAECLGLVAPLARKQGIDLIDMDGEACDEAVWADPVRLRQVVINLLSNAIKYNRPHGSVRLSCRKQEGRVRISIADTGLGIPAEKQSRIFNAFDRLGAERGSAEGTGIGLVITQRIVAAMGGRMGFESIEGQGSTFWAELPAIAPIEIQAPEAGASIADDVPAHLQGERAVVLYVEDNPMNLRLMQQIFSLRKGLELRDASSAEVGMEMASAEPPALILMDINLPGMDGFQALALLKADPKTAHIPVIAVSANAMKGDVSRGLEAGFDDYLTKPLDVGKFMELLDRILQDRKEAEK